MTTTPKETISTLKERMEDLKRQAKEDFLRDVEGPVEKILEIAEKLEISYPMALSAISGRFATKKVEPIVRKKRST